MRLGSCILGHHFSCCACKTTPGNHSDHQAKVPLSERDLSHETGLQNIAGWYQAAKLQIEEEVEGFDHSDDPTKEELQVKSALLLVYHKGSNVTRYIHVCLTCLLMFQLGIKAFGHIHMGPT